MLSNNENVLVEGSTFIQAGRDIITNYIISSPDTSTPAPRPYPLCTEGTRIKVLEDIMYWINAYPTNEPSQSISKYTTENPTILWLTGPAGVGKSTIARTLEEKCLDMGILGAICFCPEEGINKDPRKILPSIAKQLQQNRGPSTFHLDPHLVASVIQDNLNAPRIQAKRLLVGPLQEMRKGGQDLTGFVVIIDALDECLDPGEFIPTLMSFLDEDLKNFHPLRFIMTSRPRPDLKQIIQRKDSRIIPLALDQVDPQVINTDIRTYFNHSLESLHLKPTAEQLDALVEASGGLFVFAFTCMQIIKDPADNDPSGQLKKLLGWLSRGRSSEDPSICMKGLDELYTIILEQIPKPHPGSDRGRRLKTILGAVILALRPLSPESFDKLLSFKIGTTRAELERFHAVILLGPHNVSFHTSFADFLTDSQRCGDPIYNVDIQDEHANLAHHCLRIWTSSKFIKIVEDARVLRDPTALINEEERKAYATKVPAHVKYAVEYWGYHFSSSGVTHNIMTKLHAILTSQSNQILYWIEMCASMDLLRAALSSLSSTREAIEETTQAGELYPPSQTKDLCLRLENVETWVRRFYTIINSAPLQVHYLVYSPRFLAQPSAPLIKELAYAGAMPSILLPAKYNSKDSVRSVATFVSPTGGERVVAASGSRLEIWDILSGELERSFADHGARIWAVAVSPDMKYAATASSDTTVKIWDLSGGGSCTRTFRGHEEIVTAVSFSPTKTFITESEDSDNDEESDSGKGPLWKLVSGDANGTLMRWGIGTDMGKEQVLEEHTAPIRAVSYFESAEACVILSGSEDGVVLLWDVARGSRERLHLPDSAGAPITCAVISPQNHRVMACATADGLVYCWRGDQSVPTIFQRGLTGRDDNINAIGALAFTSDGEHIAYSRGDYLHIRAIYTEWNGQIPARSNAFRSLAFTHDLNNLRIVGAAGSPSSTIYVWRISKEIFHERSSGDERITCVEISPSQEFVVLGRDSSWIQLWSLKIPGQPRPLMESALDDWAKSEFVALSAAFSANNLRLVIGTGPRDGCQNTFDGRKLHLAYLDPNGSLKPRQLVQKPHCESPVKHVEISASGAQIAYPTPDGVNIWCVEKDKRICQFQIAKKKEDTTTSAFALSPDGARMVVARGDGQIGVFAVTEGQENYTSIWPPFDFGRDYADNISFTSDGKGVIAMSPSRSVVLLRADDGKVVRVVGKPTIIEEQEDPSLFGEFRDVIAAIDQLKALDAGWIGANADSTSNEWHREYTNRKIVEYLSSPQKDNDPVLVVRDQWFWCIRRQRRIMPIPASLEEGRVAQAGEWVVMASHRSGVHFLDISAMVKRLDELDQLSRLA